MKVIYVNKETGKEVHYGETITFHDRAVFGDNYAWDGDFVLPINNDTIPFLIRKGIIVRTEINNNQEEANNVLLKCNYLGVTDKPLVDLLEGILNRLDNLEQAAKETKEHECKQES